VRYGIIHCSAACCTAVSSHRSVIPIHELDYCASSRNAFDNRLRRLLAHDLLVRHDIPTMNRGVVYSISRAGASELAGRGEYYSGSSDIGKESNGHVQHALELNDIHLALKQSRTLVRWTPESDIRSRTNSRKLDT